MKKTWRRFESFLFFDYRGIERHLEKMALAGWQLSGIPIFYWEYHKTEPKKQRYTVTYIKKSSFPYPTEDQQAFYDSCGDAGWELAAQRGKMQIFRAARANPAPIETDEAAKLQSVHRIMKSDYLPATVLSLLLIFFQIYLLLSSVIKDPIRQLSSASTYFIIAIWLTLAIQCIVILITYGTWYRKSKKAAESGGACEACIGEMAYGAARFLTGAAVVLSWLSFAWQYYGFAQALGILCVIAVFFLLHAARSVLKWGEFSRFASPKLPAGIFIAASVLLTCVTTFYITGEVRAGRVGRQPVDTYTYTTPEGFPGTFDIYRDPLPLYVEDMMDTDYDRYSYRWYADRAFFLAHYVGSQSAKLSGNIAPEIYYTITDVKLPALFDLCLRAALETYHYYFADGSRVSRQTNDPLWQADAVYQPTCDNEPLNDYLVCWGNRIVTIHFDFDPTPSQIAVAAEKLRAYQ